LNGLFKVRREDWKNEDKKTELSDWGSSVFRARELWLAVLAKDAVTDQG
jgi:hypothetical protein